MGEASPPSPTQDAIPALPGDADQPPQVLSGEVPERLGEYRILREVGRGGMGVVYEAIQESLGRHVALKVLPFSGLLGPTHLERFRREARAAAALHHTNIVPVFGVGEDSGVHFFAMQYIEGQSLDRVLREVQRLRKIPNAPATSHALASQVAEALLGGRFSPANGERVASSGLGVAGILGQAEAACGAQPVAEVADGNGRSETGYFRAVARVGVQVADALEYAHRQGVLHRDIKPANLLLDTAGTVWITDFGLAKLEGNEALTSPGDLVGTLRHMAPERFEGRSEPRSDVYSLGLTLYEMLTLRPAYGDVDPVALIEHVRREAPPALRRINPRIPRDLETTVLKAMARESGDRYATAGALAEDLRHFLADRPIRARRSSTLEHCWRWCRRNRAVAGLAAGLLLALVVLAIGSTVAYVLVGFQRDRAVAAEREKTNKLWESYVEQAHARRLSRQAGQRFDSLAILRKAIDLGKSLELTSEQILRMRNEAIACLALKDLRFERQLEPKFEDNRYVAFDGRLEYYAVSDLEGTISIRSTSQDSEIARLPKPAVAPEWLGIKFSGDGRYLVIGYAIPRRPQEVFRWELKDGKPTAKLRLEQASAAFAIAPDDRHVAAECMDGSIGIYDLSSGQLQNRVAQVRNLELIVFHPDGRKLGFCAKGSRSLVVLDLETGKSSSYDHAAVVNSAAWRPDGRLQRPADSRMGYRHRSAASRARRAYQQWHRRGVQP
jgi:serine/threonine protein kinase